MPTGFFLIHARIHNSIDKTPVSTSVKLTGHLAMDVRYETFAIVHYKLLWREGRLREKDLELVRLSDNTKR